MYPQWHSQHTQLLILIIILIGIIVIIIITIGARVEICCLPLPPAPLAILSQSRFVLRSGLQLGLGLYGASEPVLKTC